MKEKFEGLDWLWTAALLSWSNQVSVEKHKIKIVFDDKIMY